MKEEIEKAVDVAIAKGWITLNENLQKSALVDLIASYTLTVTARDLARWYLR